MSNPIEDSKTAAGGATGAISPAELRTAWENLKASQPRVYPREGARTLGASEAQIVALGCGRGAAFRISPADPVALLNEAHKRFGGLLFIVRNDDAVLEKTAGLNFEIKELHGKKIASATGDGACLAFSPESIAIGFIVHAEKFIRRGFVFFDATGTAVVKAYLQDDSKIEAFDAWSAPLFVEDQSDAQSVSKEAPASAPTACPHGGCASHGDANAEVQTVPADAFKTLLKAAAKSGEPVTLGLRGNNAIFSVEAPSVTRVAPVGPWFNVLDDALHTHLRESAVTSATARIDSAAGTLRLTNTGADGKPLFWLRIPAAGAAADAVLGKESAK